MRKKITSLLKFIPVEPKVLNQNYLRFFSSQIKPQRLSWAHLKSKVDLKEASHSAFDDLKRNIFPKKEKLLFKDEVSLLKMMLIDYGTSYPVTIPITFFTALANVTLQNYLSSQSNITDFVGIECSPYFISALGFSPTLLFLASIYFVDRQNKPNNSFNDLPFQAFNQKRFNKLIESKIPEVQLNNKGNCYGHVNIWYQSHFKGINYIDELNSISKALESQQEVNPKHKKLLEGISARQFYDDYFGAPKNPYSQFLSTILPNKRQEIISNLIEEALLDPETLYGLMPSNKKSSHIIGVFADKKGTVRIFDPNFGEVICTEKNSAKIFLSKLIVENYNVSFPHLSASFSFDDYRLYTDRPSLDNRLSSSTLP